MRAILNKESHTSQAIVHLQMEAIMKGNIIWEKNKVLENTNLLMEEYIKGIGKMVNSMEKVK
jgi:hypothetical protein